jgi:hypothetical protein
MLTLEEAKQAILEMTTPDDNVDINTLNIAAQVLLDREEMHRKEALKMANAIQGLVKKLEDVLKR